MREFYLFRRMQKCLGTMAMVLLVAAVEAEICNNGCSDSSSSPQIIIIIIFIVIVIIIVIVIAIDQQHKDNDGNQVMIWVKGLWHDHHL